MGQCISRRPIGSYSATQNFGGTSDTGDKVVLVSPSDEKQTQKKSNLTKGVAMSFGFRKKPPPTTTYGNPAAARRLAANDSIDKNGNDDVNSIPPSGRSTPKLVPPRKEPHSTRVSRFGFRQPNQNRLNKIGDKPQIQPITSHLQINAKIENNNLEVTKPKVTFLENNNNNKDKNKLNKQPTKFTLQTSSLPRPQFPVRVIESKTTKTLINTSTKRINQKKKSSPVIEEDMSLFKDEVDSGVSSQENDSKSPTTSDEVIRKQRSLEIVLKDHNFDVKDIDDSSSIEKELQIPKLKTCFDVNIHNTGSVKEKAQEYERKLERKKVNEKFEKNFNPIGRFLKSGVNSDSDDQWSNAAGEAMAEDFSLSSTSDEVKTKIAEDEAFQRLLHSSFDVLEKTNSCKLIQNEPSPTDIPSFSETEIEFKCKERRSSDSKDICSEKSSNPPSPGTPTNVSDSLSLSDGKDFLIDDEIADQPALVFDDNKCSDDRTLIESTPKIKRKNPIFFKNNKKFLSRSDSVETLSTCESITSDDLMLDYEIHHEMISENRFDGKNCLNGLTDKSEGRDWPLIMGQLEKQIGKHTDRTSRLLRSRGGTPDSSRSLETRSNSSKTRNSFTENPLTLQPSRMAIDSPLTGYESDDSIRIERSSHNVMVQEVMGMKTMLLKLKRVLHEAESQNPFEVQRNGFFPEQTDDVQNYKLEVEDLKRQVLFLQGQVEDRDKQLQELVAKNEASTSAPSSIITVETSNAATQTEKIRPISAGPSLLSSTGDNSIVSATERKKSSRLLKVPTISPKPSNKTGSSKKSLTPSTSSIPIRSASRTRRSPTLS
ncbi:uncharacterized protein [Onthophagus taurus]|uniref:uncharacterized protein isoform X2 n=1 Tax=Onthophagus taurus TaxID=166361 RepID=UPI0039BE5D66